MACVFIKNMRFHAKHGVLMQERKVGADFIVSIQVMADIQKAFTTDCVEDIISYATLFHLVKREMDIPSALLEHVAARIATSIFKVFDKAKEVEVEITKTNPPMGAQCDGAGVRETFTRHGLIDDEYINK
ncbi:MAG: dihydroneopterin aldolase [Prevotella sp.]|nr:dihydroneopterin aldolase [Prevotella sp.]